MKPFIYKRFGQWNIRTGVTVVTIWSDWVGDLSLHQAVEHFQWRVDNGL